MPVFLSTLAKINVLCRMHIPRQNAGPGGAGWASAWARAVIASLDSRRKRISDRCQSDVAGRDSTRTRSVARDQMHTSTDTQIQTQISHRC